MSNNAREAYENGEKPISKWTKTDIVKAVADISPEAAVAASKVQVGTQTETGEAKYEIKETTDGRKVAVVEDDILGNIDSSSWNDEKKRAAQKAASKAMEKFKDGIPVYGTTVRVYGRSKKELTRSRETENLYRNDKTAFADKIRTAPITDDVLYATSDWSRDGKLKHPRKDDFVDFMHGDVLISSLGRNYIAHTTVGITEDGEYVYYGINDLDVGDFEIKTSETPTAVSTQENVLDDVSGVPDRLSVPQSKRSVKSDAAESSISTAAKFSMKSDVEATNNLAFIYLQQHEKYEARLPRGRRPASRKVSKKQKIQQSR